MPDWTLRQEWGARPPRQAPPGPPLRPTRGGLALTSGSGRGGPGQGGPAWSCRGGGPAPDTVPSAPAQSWASPSTSCCGDPGPPKSVPSPTPGQAGQRARAWAGALRSGRAPALSDPCPSLPDPAAPSSALIWQRPLPTLISALRGDAPGRGASARGSPRLGHICPDALDAPGWRALGWWQRCTP